MNQIFALIEDDKIRILKINSCTAWAEVQKNRISKKDKILYKITMQLLLHLSFDCKYSKLTEMQWKAVKLCPFSVRRMMTVTKQLIANSD